MSSLKIYIKEMEEKNAKDGIVREDSGIVADDNASVSMANRYSFLCCTSYLLVAKTF